MQKLILTFRLSQQQSDALRAEAERLGISVGELLRRLIDAANFSRRSE